MTKKKKKTKHHKKNIHNLHFFNEGAFWSDEPQNSHSSPSKNNSSLIRFTRFCAYW